MINDNVSRGPADLFCSLLQVLLLGGALLSAALSLLSRPATRCSVAPVLWPHHVCRVGAGSLPQGWE